MKRRSTLLLMELLLMVLVFAAASAILLQVFVRADHISRRSSGRSEAAILAQTAAERWKAGEAVEQNQGEYTLRVTEEETEYLTRAHIQVSKEGETLFALTAARQREVSGGG